MAAKQISVKKYVVRLNGEERQQLETLIRKGKSPARRLLKARILLKADVSEAGEDWSNGRSIEAKRTWWPDRADSMDANIIRQALRLQPPGATVDEIIGWVEQAGAARKWQ